MHHDPYNHASFNALPSSYHDYRELHGAYSSWDLYNSSYRPSPHVESPSSALSFPNFSSPESTHGCVHNELLSDHHVSSVEPHAFSPHLSRTEKIDYILAILRDQQKDIDELQGINRSRGPGLGESEIEERCIEESSFREIFVKNDGRVYETISGENDGELASCSDENDEFDRTSDLDDLGFVLEQIKPFPPLESREPILVYIYVIG